MALGTGTVSASNLLLALLLNLVPAPAVEAQFTCATNSGAITITGYTGPGGAVTIPSATNGLPVTSIGAGAFAFAYGLTSVAIPTGVTSIGDSAFQRCGALTGRITIPNSVTNIGDFAFQGCSRLTSVAIPDGITIIGDYTFEGCGLTNITIPSSVTSIGASAFQNCGALAGSITIPSSVTSIGSYAFSGCDMLRDVYFEGDAPRGDMSVFSDDDDSALTLYYLPGTTGLGSTFGTFARTVLWNPQMHTSHLGFGVRANDFGFIATGTSGLVVVVQASTNLANPAWSGLVTNTLTALGAFSFGDPQWTNYPARFYRLRWP